MNDVGILVEESKDMKRRKELDKRGKVWGESNADFTSNFSIQ